MHKPFIGNLGLANSYVCQIFLFGAVYSFVYTPLTATYCAEVLDTTNRAKGMGVVGTPAPL